MSVRKGARRVSVTVSDEEYEKLKYWSDRNELSVNEYILEAIERQIRYENGDYDLPTLEQARLNQLIDIITTLSYNQKSLEDTVIAGFDSLLGLVKGDNYLLRDEDGDIYNT